MCAMHTHVRQRWDEKRLKALTPFNYFSTIINERKELEIRKKPRRWKTNCCSRFIFRELV